MTNLAELRRLEPFSKEETLLRAIMKVKQVSAGLTLPWRWSPTTTGLLKGAARLVIVLCWPVGQLDVSNDSESGTAGV